MATTAATPQPMSSRLRRPDFGAEADGGVVVLVGDAAGGGGAAA